MKAKKEVEVSETPILYDAQAPQTINLNFKRNGKDYRLSHVLDPLSEERLIAFEKEVSDAGKKLAKQQAITTTIFAAQVSLWNDLATSVEGYKVREDFKQSVPAEHKVTAIKTLLDAEIITDPIIDESGDIRSDLWDVEEETQILMNCYFNGAKVGTAHFFKKASVADKDEYLALLQNLPAKNVLASAVQKNKIERLISLYDKLSASVEGYANNQVPGWHKTQAVSQFFDEVLEVDPK